MATKMSKINQFRLENQLRVTTQPLYKKININGRDDSDQMSQTSFFHQSLRQKFQPIQQISHEIANSKFKFQSTVSICLLPQQTNDSTDNRFKIKKNQKDRQFKIDSNTGFNNKGFKLTPEKNLIVFFKNQWKQKIQLFKNMMVSLKQMKVTVLSSIQKEINAMKIHIQNMKDQFCNSLIKKMSYIVFEKELIIQEQNFKISSLNKKIKELSSLKQEQPISSKIISSNQHQIKVLNNEISNLQLIITEMKNRQTNNLSLKTQEILKMNKNLTEVNSNLQSKIEKLKLNFTKLYLKEISSGQSFNQDYDENNFQIQKFINYDSKAQNQQIQFQKNQRHKYSFADLAQKEQSYLKLRSFLDKSQSSRKINKNSNILLFKDKNEQQISQRKVNKSQTIKSDKFQFIKNKILQLKRDIQFDL